VIYITNLSKRAKEYELEEIFKKYGVIKEIKIVKDPFSKESRGFGFITFESNSQAEEAISVLNNTEFDGRMISCEVAKRNRGRTSTPGVYLGPTSAKRMRGGKYDRPRYHHSRNSRSRSFSRRRYRKYEPRSWSRSRSPYYSRSRSLSRRR
jgi:transformer-2 protein